MRLVNHEIQLTTTRVSSYRQCVSERDESIGENLALLRGQRSQQWVADEMRSRGHKWSQATVWAVEKGDRPLRLTEAEDLAEILQLRAPTDLLRNKLTLSVEAVTLQYKVALVQLVKMQREAEQRRGVLRELLSNPEFDPSGLSEVTAKDAREFVEKTTLDLLRDVSDARDEAAWRRQQGRPSDG